VPEIQVVDAWNLQPGAQLQDGRTVDNVQREPFLRTVALTTRGPEGLSWEVLVGAAPVPVLVRPDGPLPKRTPGEALMALVRRWGPLR
jgi:hypothetical protein